MDLVPRTLLADPVIAGIDMSTRFVDVVFLDEDTDAATWHRFPLFGHDAFERTRSVRDGLAGSLWDDALAIGIEEPMMRGGGMSSAYSLYRVQGAILACLPRSTLVHPLKPSVWRKTVGLPGNASKADVAYFVKTARYRTHDWKLFRDWPQDACDAYCIALATRSLLQHGERAA